MAQRIGTRAEDLSGKVRRAVTDWALELEGLTPEQWTMTGRNAPDFTMGEDENRRVGVIVHHIAVGLDLHADTVKQLAQGLPSYMPTLDIDGLAELNAKHAEENPHPDKDATLQLLRDKGAVLAEAMRRLTDDELDRSGKVYGLDLTAEQFVNQIAIGHGNWHLSSIRATIGR